MEERDLDEKTDREGSDASHVEQSHDLQATETQREKQAVDEEHGQPGAKDAQEVQWTFKRCIAIAALCGSYVGTFKIY